MHETYISECLKKVRSKKGYSQKQLAEVLNVAQNTVSNWEKGIRQPDLTTITKIADFFNVSTDYLLGRSLYAVIEKRLNELNMTEEDLEKELDLPKGMIESLDTFPPAPWDYQRGELIDRISNVLKMDFKTLATAYARQEPPAYDGSPESIKEAFNEDIHTIAAHHDGEDWTEEELEEIEQFKEFVRMRRKQQE